MSKTFNNIYVKRHPFTKSINYNELRIYKDISEKISLQCYKTVTCNISVSESSVCTMEVHQEVSDLPVDIGTKLLTTSLENPNWHTGMDKQHTTVISCNISQTQYLCQKLQL